MKIRTVLRFTSGLSVITLAALVVGSGISFHLLKRATALEVFLIELQGNILERIAVRDDFLFMGQRRGLVQWQLKTAELEKHLGDLSQMTFARQRATLVERMNRNFKATITLFHRILDLRASAGGDHQARSEDRVLEQRLMNQLIVKAYLFSGSTQILLLEARQETVQARNRLMTLLAIFTLLLGITVFGTTAYLSRRLSRGITALKMGTDIVSEGRLDYRIPAEGKDELADLARQFNSMADRLKHSYQSLEAANRELEGFSYTVSHDLRTPLRHVLSFSELLQRQNAEGLDEKSRHYLDVICKGALLMGRLIEDLLSYAHTGQAEMTKKTVHLNEVVAAVVRDLEPFSAGRSITWAISPLPMVSGDAVMLRLVMENLLANALKFSRPRLQTVIEVGSRVDGEYNVVFIRDNGVGFDMQFANKLFGLFQRLHRTDEFEGTGLGLANVQRIVQRHGGRIWAESKMDEGAIFFISLPKIQEERL